MVCKDKEATVLKLHDSCQKFLSEQAELRDRTITFYIAVCTLFTGWFGVSFSSIHQSIAGYVLVAMMIIGVICCIRVIGHRSWHLQYVKCIKALNGILLSDKIYSDMDEIQNFFNYTIIGTEKVSFISLFSSIGNLTVVAFSLLTTIPVWVWSYAVPNIDGSNTFMYCSLFSIAYCVVSELYLFYRLKAANHFPTWILQMAVPPSSKPSK